LASFWYLWLAMAISWYGRRTVSQYPRGFTPLSEVRGSPDQVMRLREFRKARPDVEISSPRQNASRAWKAVFGEANGYTEINRFELRELLDDLEKRFA
jgi:hypothetical protein